MEREKHGGAEIGVTTAMVLAQLFQVGLNTIIKSAMANGMSNFVFIVYSNAMALCFLLPSAFFFHRNRPPPSMSMSVLYRIFLLSLLGYCVVTCIYGGIGYSSPTLASALEDLIPAFTFMLAIISRMEKLDLKLQSCQSKIIGTVISIMGALTVTFYKGMPIASGSHILNRELNGIFLSTRSNWLFGGFLITVGSFCLSLSSIIQTWIMKDYPAELIVTTISCIFGAVISTIVALIVEPSPKTWVLKPDMEIVAILYSINQHIIRLKRILRLIDLAIFLVSMRNIVYAWACRKKGPLYVGMFHPLAIVFAVCLGFVFLGDSLYLGSLIGAVIISVGFYAVLWGQAQEEKVAEEKNGIHNHVPSCCAAPLLQNKNMDV